MKTVIFIVFFSLYFIPATLIRDRVISVFSVLWFVFTIIYVIYIYNNRDKEYEKTYMEEYYKSLPSNISPEILGYLLTCSTKKEYLTAVIMDLIRKESIKVRKEKKDYILIDNNEFDIYLSKSQLYIKKWFFKSMGNRKEVSFTDIKNEAKYNSGYFSYCYNEWMSLLNIECARYDFFENKKDIIEFMLFYTSISILFILYNIFLTYNYIVAVLMLVAIIGFIIYINNFYRRNKESNEEYEEWMAFKRYLEKELNNIEKINTDTLATYSVYAKILGLNKEFDDAIRNKTNKKIFEENELLSLISSNAIEELDKIISFSVRKSFISTLFLVRNNGHNVLRK